MRSTPVQPRNLLERELLEIWSGRLAGQPFGVTDHYFSLGGDSLSAIRLLAEAQRRYAVRIDRRRLFEVFTIATMAELIAEAGTGAQR